MIRSSPLEPSEIDSRGVSPFLEPDRPHRWV